MRFLFVFLLIFLLRLTSKCTHSSTISFLLSFLACKVLRAGIYTDQAYNNSKSRDSFQLPYDETDKVIE